MTATFRAWRWRVGELHEQIALFIASYRMTGGDPSVTASAVVAAFPGATMADYAIGLLQANRASRRVEAHAQGARL